MFDVEMLVERIDLIQNGEPLSCFPLMILLEVFCKYLSDCYFDIIGALHGGKGHNYPLKAADFHSLPSKVIFATNCFKK